MSLLESAPQNEAQEADSGASDLIETRIALRAARIIKRNRGFQEHVNDQGDHVRTYPNGNTTTIKSILSDRPLVIQSSGNFDKPEGVGDASA